MKTAARKFIAATLVVSTASMLTPGAAQAEMLGIQAKGKTDRERIVLLLERREVQAQLQARGVDPVQARARIAALSEEEVADLAAGMDERPAAGRDSPEQFADAYNSAMFVVLGVLVALLLIIALVQAISRASKGGDS